MLFVEPVTLLNFYDKCSMTNCSLPPSMTLPWTSLCWGRAPLLFNHMGISPSIPGGNMTALQPLYPPLTLLWSVLNRNRAWLWSVCMSAMRHLPYAVVAGFSMALQSISLNQYMRNKFDLMYCHCFTQASIPGAWKLLVQAFQVFYLKEFKLKKINKSHIDVDNNYF